MVGGIIGQTAPLKLQPYEFIVIQQILTWQDINVSFMFLIVCAHDRSPQKVVTFLLPPILRLSPF